METDRNPTEEALEALRGAPEDVGVPVLTFTEVPLEATRIRAEYVRRGAHEEDLLFHFFRTPETSPALWTRDFPAWLDRYAQAFFGAGADRLSAARVDELGIDSWWLLARGYGDSPFWELRVERFLAGFDAGLAAMRSTDPR